MLTGSDYYNSLPKKRMGSGVLFFNNKGELLVLKPSYKDGYEIPGGSIELDESPRKAVLREVEEEIGIDVYSSEIAKLLCVDYQDAVEPKTESIMFIFDGGILSDEKLSQIKVDGKEIIDFKFINQDDVLKYLTRVVGRRVQQALIARRNNSCVYLENRELVV